MDLFHWFTIYTRNEVNPLPAANKLLSHTRSVLTLLVWGREIICDKMHKSAVELNLWLWCNVAGIQSRHADSKIPASVYALASEMISEVLDVMLDLAKEGMAMLVVSHEMGFTKKAAGKVVFMDNGEVIEMSAPNAVFSNPQSERTKCLLTHIL